MVRLTLSAPLFDLVPETERADGERAPRTIRLHADDWPGLVRECRERFPALAARVLTESGAIAAGFALVINDEVAASGGQLPAISAGDDLAVIAVIAGGCGAEGSVQLVQKRRCQ